VRNQLLVELLNDALTDYAYEAGLAGLQFNLASTARGLDLRVEGFSEKQSCFVLKLVEELLRCVDFEPLRFQVPRFPACNCL